MAIVRNPAAAEGPKRFGWWKDWRGETVAIVACGPSVRREDVEKLRGRVKVVAIKASVDLCPWADVVYGCDAAWWHSRQGLPKFEGLRLSFDAGALDAYPWINRIEIDRERHEILVDRPALIGNGGNSGQQAVNIVTQFGARRILGLGFDFRDTHWYGRNIWPMANNPDEANFTRWRRNMHVVAKDLRRLGVEFLNCSLTSTITSFRKMTITDALEECSSVVAA